MENKQNIFRANIIKLSLIFLIYSVVTFVTSAIMFSKPPTYRLTNASPATTLWLSTLSLIDSFHLIVGACITTVYYEPVRWVLDSKFMVVIYIIKFCLYFTSGVCLAANAVPDGIGSATAFIASLSCLVLLRIRMEFFKVYNEEM